jgi:hypothetical protein
MTATGAGQAEAVTDDSFAESWELFESAVGFRTVAFSGAGTGHAWRQVGFAAVNESSA